MSQRTIPTLHPPPPLSSPNQLVLPHPIILPLAHTTVPSVRTTRTNGFLPGHAVTAAGEASARPDVCRAASSIEDASPWVRGQGTWCHALEVLAAHGCLQHRHVLSGRCRRAFSRSFCCLLIIDFDEYKLLAPPTPNREGVGDAFFFTALDSQLMERRKSQLVIKGQRGRRNWSEPANASGVRQYGTTYSGFCRAAGNRIRGICVIFFLNEAVSGLEGVLLKTGSACFPAQSCRGRSRNGSNIPSKTVTAAVVLLCSQT